MADLIDRAVLLKAIQKEAVNAMELNANRHCESALAFGHCYSMVKKAPAVDAVEVVRCRECRYFSESGERPELYGFCHLYPLALSRLSNGFCDMGERRTDGSTDRC